MLSLPSAARPLLMSFSAAFTKPTFRRVLLLMAGAILTLGDRTVTGMLRALRGVAPGDASAYHRVFSRASWSLWPLAKLLAGAVLALVPSTEPVLVAMDDTTAQHRGKCVYGKGCHHDAVRSARKHIVFRWGHRWIVLAISVRLPFSGRRWALPVLTALYRPEALDQREGRRHKTAPELARQLMAALIHWFPERKFIFLGDGGYACHQLARFCHRHRRHATLISRFRGDACLYAPTPRRGKRTGRPRIKGRKRASPQQVVAHRVLTEATVQWYGGGTRRVRLASGTGLWYKSGKGVVAIRWVFVRDAQGTHRDDYFYTTDPALSGEQMVNWFGARWPIETTFQEVRGHLGFETTRQHVANSVLRTAPCLLGLFSVVCLIFATHAQRHRVALRQRPWYHKDEPTFADAMATVRRLFWQHTLFQEPSYRRMFKNLSPSVRNWMLDQLSQAA
jgi:hypothetical protein